MKKLKKFLSTHVPHVTWEYEVPLSTPERFHGEQEDWNQTLMTKINQISAMISKDSMRGGANVILIPSHLVGLIQSLLYMNVNIVKYKGYYIFGALAGRYRVCVVPKITKIKWESYIGVQPNTIDIDENKIFVCRLKDVDKILDVDNYEKVGVVDVKIQYKSSTDK